MNNMCIAIEFNWSSSNIAIILQNTHNSILLLSSNVNFWLFLF